MNGKGILYVVSGPSGVGKGTIVNNLLVYKPDVYLSVSATTRAPREGEVEGRNYFFISDGEFKRMSGEGGFIEWAQFCGNCYGTPKGRVLDALDSGRDCILEIEVQGAMKVMDSFSAVFVYVIPPSMEDLKDRLVKRCTEDMDVISKRLDTAAWEISFLDRYNYIIVNDDVDAATKRLASIMDAERCRMERNYDIAKTVFNL